MVADFSILVVFDVTVDIWLVDVHHSLSLLGLSLCSCSISFLESPRSDAAYVKNHGPRVSKVTSSTVKSDSISKTTNAAMHVS